VVPSSLDLNHDLEALRLVGIPEQPPERGPPVLEKVSPVTPGIARLVSKPQEQGKPRIGLAVPVTAKLCPERVIYRVKPGTEPAIAEL